MAGAERPVRPPVLLLPGGQRPPLVARGAAVTGPEHYQAAEDHLKTAATEELGSAQERWLLVAAQVHATLALAAATALADHNAGPGHPVLDAWWQVAT